MTRYREVRPMCTQDRLMKLSSEVHRVGARWFMSVPTEASVADAEGWAITLAGVPGQARESVDVVAESLDAALDLAIDVIGGAS
jgi:hypothetical protein